jgi:hypothetical protein
MGVLLLFPAHTLRNMPKSVVPVGTPRKRYIAASLEAPITQGTKLVNLTRWFASASLAIGLILTGIFAFNSSPGTTLYSFKSGSQKLRLSFISNDNARINLQLAFAEERLQETQKVLDSNVDSKTKSAALAELGSQTLSTVETVRQVAIAQKNTELLNRLSSITTNQARLITNATDPEVQDAAKIAMAATEAGSKSIAQTKLLVAASNDSAITKLPSVISTISGSITKITTNTITVGKDTILITEKTEIVTDGKTSDANVVIKLGQQVKVEVFTQNDTFTASKITISSESLKPKTPPSATGTNETQLITPETDPLTDTTSVQSGFLIENPAPQYPEN